LRDTLSEFPGEGDGQGQFVTGKAGAEIWRKMEKAVWIFWLFLPPAILLWAKFVMNSK
jgi:hypothetical protein